MLVVLLLIQQANSIKAKYIGSDVNFQRKITSSVSHTLVLEKDITAKGYTYFKLAMKGFNYG